MELSTLMQRISSNDIPHFLILYGEEQTILSIYIDRIVEATKGMKVVQDAVHSVTRKSGLKSLDKSTKIYVVTDDFDFLKSEDAWKSVKDSFKRDFLILRYHSLDKRSAFYKQNKESVVEFSKLTESVLESYIYKDLPDLSDENAKKLISCCNSDYGRILLESDKLKHYCHASDYSLPMPMDDCFEELDRQGLFNPDIGDVTFELTNAILGGYSKKAIKKLDEAKRKGEPAIRIATILYNGFRNLLAFQGLGANRQNAAERTGLTKGEIYGCTKNVGGYTLDEIRRNMLFCKKAEADIKAGLLDDDIALEYIVLNCLK